MRSRLSGLALPLALSTGCLWPMLTYAVSPVVYRIAFFDETGSEVGAGMFRVRRVQPRCIQHKAPDDCADRGPNRSRREVTATLADFRATIVGETWKLTQPDSSWWGDSRHRSGQQHIHRGITYEPSPVWVFGDTATGTRLMQMNFSTAGDASGSGAWEQITVNSAGGPPTISKGRWSAAPEGTAAP